MTNAQIKALQMMAANQDATHESSHVREDKLGLYEVDFAYLVSMGWVTRGIRPMWRITSEGRAALKRHE